MRSLCQSCTHVREVVSGTGSRFLLCRLSLESAQFAKYPPQPLYSCTGYALAAPKASSSDEAPPESEPPSQRPE